MTNILTVLPLDMFNLIRKQLLQYDCLAFDISCKQLYSQRPKYLHGVHPWVLICKFDPEKTFPNYFWHQNMALPKFVSPGPDYRYYVGPDVDYHTSVEMFTNTSSQNKEFFSDYNYRKRNFKYCISEYIRELDDAQLRYILYETNHGRRHCFLNNFDSDSNDTDCGYEVDDDDYWLVSYFEHITPNMICVLMEDKKWDLIDTFLRRNGLDRRIKYIYSQSEARFCTASKLFQCLINLLNQINFRNLSEDDNVMLFYIMTFYSFEFRFHGDHLLTPEQLRFLVRAITYSFKYISDNQWWFDDYAKRKGIYTIEVVFNSIRNTWGSLLWYLILECINTHGRDIVVEIFTRPSNDYEEAVFLGDFFGDFFFYDNLVLVNNMHRLLNKELSSNYYSLAIRYNHKDAYLLKWLQEKGCALDLDDDNEYNAINKLINDSRIYDDTICDWFVEQWENPYRDHLIKKNKEKETKKRKQPIDNNDQGEERVIKSPRLG